MPDALLLLHLEHENFNGLLDLIDEQRHNLEQGNDVDINLLKSVAEYFSGYPDECHHPIEDTVLRQLCMRDSKAVPDLDLDKLSKEHKEIERLTGLLATTLSACAHAGDAQTPELGEVMQQFVNYYRDHMMMEEEHFFPLAAKALLKEDWKKIEFDLFYREDPLLERGAHERFQILREIIESSARESYRRAARLRQEKRV